MAKLITKNYILISSDAGTIIDGLAKSEITVTIPSNRSVPFKIGTEIAFSQEDSASIVFKGVTGVTLQSFNNNKRTAGQFAMASLLKKAENVWQIVGNLKN